MHDTKPMYSEPSRLDKDYAYIPLYDIHASAGGGAYVQGEGEEIKDVLAFRSNWITQELRVNPRDLSVIFVEGESMSPTLSPGDIILIRKFDNQIIQDGVYVVRLEDAILVKRLQRLPGGIIQVLSSFSKIPQVVSG